MLVNRLVDFIADKFAFFPPEPNYDIGEVSDKLCIYVSDGIG